MEILLKSLTQYCGQILLILCLLNLGFLVGYARLRRKIDRSNVDTRKILSGADGQNVEKMLLRHLHERSDAEEQIGLLARRVSDLEKQLASSKRHLGIVRYDAFDDVGGNQSFALALFDDNGDGAVLNGVVGRSTAKVYCKPLVNGRSDRNLSQEEQRAIREGRDTAAKSVISL
jgi:hypothetical protein